MKRAPKAQPPRSAKTAVLLLIAAIVAIVALATCSPVVEVKVDVTHRVLVPYEAPIPPAPPPPLRQHFRL